MLRADGFFDLDVRFAFFEVRWLIRGQWRPAEGSTVELVVTESRVSPPFDPGDGSPAQDGMEPGTILVALVTADRASFGGPCVHFDMSRQAVATFSAPGRASAVAAALVSGTHDKVR